MEPMDKLRILIPHWIQHNQEHAEEFARWAALDHPAGGHIKAAAEWMEKANAELRQALDLLGGPAESPLDPHGHTR